MNDEMTALVPHSSGEIDISANAAAAIAEVQAAYVMAIKNPRNIFDARKRMLEACERKKFSEKARYHRVVGKDKFGKDVYADGFSVHFARPAAVMMRNILINAGVLYEDEKIRKVVARATDIEANVAYTKEAIIQKAVERKNARGRDVISQRTNSRGDTTYLVVAYPHEVDLAAAKTTAILIRDCVLPLIPPDILEEIEEKIVDVMASELTSDPITARKKLVDAFAALGVSSAQLRQYLKHEIEDITPQEYVNLRAIYQALKDGQSQWFDYVEDRQATDIKSTDGRQKYEKGTEKSNDGKESADWGFQQDQATEEQPTTTTDDLPPNDQPSSEISDADRKILTSTLVKRLMKKGIKAEARHNAEVATMCQAAGASDIEGIKTLDQFNAAQDWINETWAE